MLLPGIRFPALCLLFAALAAAVDVSADNAFTVHTAVFSDRQTFWPGLEDPMTPATLKPGKAGKTVGAKASAGKSAGKGVGDGSGKDGTRAEAKAGRRMVVLPIRIASKDWRESIPCDSCHRLSPNGMEFFLENYLAGRLNRRFPGDTVELAAPHVPLLQAAHLRLLEYQDSLRLPWDKWFDGYTEALIYRPRDAMTTAADIRRLDKLGGLLGATHLLLPAKVWASVVPRARDSHSGDLEWGFHLLFWNVAEGRVEWAMALSEKAPGVDLDAALDERLDKALLAAWDSLPAELAAYWKSEPR